MKTKTTNRLDETDYLLNSPKNKERLKLALKGKGETFKSLSHMEEAIYENQNK